MMKSSQKESLAHKVTSTEHKLKASLENTKSEREEMEKCKEQLKEAKLCLDSTENKLAQLTVEITESEKQIILHKSEVSAMEEEREGRKQDRKIKEALEELKKYEKGYHGLFYELIHPIQSKYEIAIKVALQGVLRMLVVDSVEVAQIVDEYLTEKGLYLDCLILSKVPKETSDIHSKRKKLEGKGHMVVDVVDCDKGIKGLEGALKFFCGDKVVCLDDGGIENTVYLSNKGFKRIITLDGTKLSNGMFESGHQSNIFDKSLGGVKHDKLIKEKRNALSKAEEILSNLLTEKSNYEETIKKAKSEMITKETQIRLMEENMSHVTKLHEEKEDLIDKCKKEIIELEEELKQLNSQRKDYNKKLNSLQKELNEIEQDEFAEFLKKAKINSLSEFEGVNMKEFEENARLKQSYKDNLFNIRSQIEKLEIDKWLKANEILAAEEEEVNKTAVEFEDKIKTLTEELELKKLEQANKMSSINPNQKDKESEEIEVRFNYEFITF